MLDSFLCGIGTVVYWAHLAMCILIPFLLVFFPPPWGV